MLIWFRQTHETSQVAASPASALLIHTVTSTTVAIQQCIYYLCDRSHHICSKHLPPADAHPGAASSCSQLTLADRGRHLVVRGQGHSSGLHPSGDVKKLYRSQLSVTLPSSVWSPGISVIITCVMQIYPNVTLTYKCSIFKVRGQGW